MAPKTATEEIISIIKRLDREESLLVVRRGKLQTEIEALDSEIIRVGTGRRQFEFALKSLGVDEIPVSKKIPIRNDSPRDPIPVPVKNNVIGQLG